MNALRLSGCALVELLANPASVAVVGASGDPQAAAGRPLRYLREHGFRGRVTAVNPRYTDIAGVPCLARVEDLESGTADIGVVNLPAAKVADAVEALAERGVRAAIVIGSGFEDADSQPRRDLLQVLDRSDLRLIGPNCVGVMTPSTGAHLNFSSVLLRHRPRTGRIGLVTQSGALGNSVLLSLLSRGAGVATWFSTGDELSVGALELVAGLLPREDVDGVGIFLEGFTDLDWLPQVRQAISTTGKPVFVLKAASTDLGRLAASGHTGRVVGSSDVSRAILEEAGVIDVPDLAALTDVLVALDVIGRPGGGRVGVVSVSGASAVVTADRIRGSRGLQLADIGGDRGHELEARLDPRIHFRNPFDVPFLDETSVFANAVAACSGSPLIDAVIAVESGLAHDRGQLADGLVDARRLAPILLSQLSEDDRIPAEVVERLAAAGIAVLPTPERAVAALDRLVPPRCPAAEAGPPAPASTLGLEAVANLAPGFPIAPWQVVDSVEAAARAGAELGYPVVIKAAGRVIAHRSEVGAVAMGVTADTLERSFARVDAVCRKAGDAVVVQKQELQGFELMVAGIVDPETGPAVFVRPGGVLAELLRDQTVIWGGWDASARRQCLRGSGLGQILDGYRGGARYDLGALAELIDRTLDVLEAGVLAFIEFNPVILRPNGVVAVDVLAARKEG